MSRLPINKVFTPRSANVNTDMYIKRETLEKVLIRSVLGSMHCFLFGESGNGKSWLYKKTFLDNSINYVVANCAKASSLKSLISEITSVCVSENVLVSQSRGQNTTNELDSRLDNIDLLELAFKELNAKSNGNKSVIVVDNVEIIFNDENLLKELSDLIILLDDERYAIYEVKLLLVGVPNEVLNYFSSSQNPASVGNRIDELPKVKGLNKTQVINFVEKGFVKHLQVSLSDRNINEISSHIYNVTLGIPQRMHEYCECLAYAIEDSSWRFDRGLFDSVDHQWMIKGLRECYVVVERLLNSEETQTGRRNQVIYALGKSTGHIHSTSSVGQKVREEFPDTAPDSNSGIGQILAFLSKAETPMLKVVSNMDGYTFCDPRLLMCIRVMIMKDEITEKVSIRKFKFG